jgi:hypothetical protein
MVTLSELRNQTFLVNPRSLAPGAVEGLKLMCREFGRFEANLVESAVASTVALDTDWRPIRDDTAIAVMAETTAHTVRAEGIVVVPVQPPPQYVLTLAWRHDEHAAAAHRFLAYLRCYRDQHAWITNGESESPIQNRSASLIVNAAEPSTLQAETATDSEINPQSTQFAHPQSGEPAPLSIATALSLLL